MTMTDHRMTKALNKITHDNKRYNKNVKKEFTDFELLIAFYSHK